MVLFINPPVMRFNILLDTFETKTLHEILAPCLRNREEDLPMLWEFFTTLTEILQDKTLVYAMPRMVYEREHITAKQGPFTGKTVTLTLYKYNEEKCQLVILVDGKFNSQQIADNEENKKLFRKMKKFLNTEVIVTKEVKEPKK